MLQAREDPESRKGQTLHMADANGFGGERHGLGVDLLLWG